MNVQQHIKLLIWNALGMCPVCERVDGLDNRYKGKTFKDNPGKVALHIRRLGRHQAYIRCSFCGVCFSVSYHQLVKALRTHASEYEAGKVGSGISGVAQGLRERADAIERLTLPNQRGEISRGEREAVARGTAGYGQA